MVVVPSPFVYVLFKGPNPVAIKEKNPWFLQMWDLIQDHPNALIHLSGDSTSSVDPGIFLSSNRAKEPWETSSLEDVEDALAEVANLISEASGTSGLAGDDHLECANTESGAATPVKKTKRAQSRRDLESLRGM